MKLIGNYYLLGTIIKKHVNKKTDLNHFLRTVKTYSQDLYAMWVEVTNIWWKLSAKRVLNASVIWNVLKTIVKMLPRDLSEQFCWVIFEALG